MMMMTSDDFNISVQHDNHEEYDEKTGNKKLVTHASRTTTIAPHRVLPWHGWDDHLEQECCDEFKRFFEHGYHVEHKEGEKYIKFTDANEQILNYCPFCGKRLEVIIQE